MLGVLTPDTHHGERYVSVVFIGIAFQDGPHDGVGQLLGGMQMEFITHGERRLTESGRVVCPVSIAAGIGSNHIALPVFLVGNAIYHAGQLTVIDFLYSCAMIEQSFRTSLGIVILFPNLLP